MRDAATPRDDQQARVYLQRQRAAGGGGRVIYIFLILFVNTWCAAVC